MQEELKKQLLGVKRYLNEATAFKSEILHQAVESAVEQQAARYRQWGGWYLSSNSAADVDRELTREEIYEALNASISLRTAIAMSKAKLKALVMDKKLTEGSDPFHTERGWTSSQYGLHFPDTMNINIEVNRRFMDTLLSSKLAAEPLSGHLLYLTDDYWSFGYTCPVKVRKGQAVSKAILKAINSCDLLAEPRKAQWSKLMERLGQLWSSRSQGLVVHLSCSPLDFLNMGMWGENSCYRAGSEQEMSKLVLMNAENAIVMKVMKEGEDPAGKPMARAWGFWLDGEGLIVTNIYQMYWKQVIPLLRTAVAGWLGKEVKAAGEEIPGAKGIKGTLLKDFGVYTNGDTHGFGDDIAGMVKKLQKVKVNWKLALCPRCRKATPEGEIGDCELGCGVRHCHNCQIDAMNENGEKIRICRECASTKDSRSCQGCNKRVYFVSAKPTGGCSRCADWWCNDCNGTVEVDDEGLCKPCADYKRRMEARARGEDGPWEKIEGCECAACMATA